MSAQPNYYQMLGLTPSATAEQIKKQYRELARRFHPDVNSNPDASQKILSINQAYHVLGDAGRRAAYDADRVLRQQAPPRPAAPAPPPRARRAPAGPQTPSRPRVEFNGFGRVYTDPPGHDRQTRHAAGPAPASRHLHNSQDTTLERMITEAKLAFINRQYKQAMDLCREVLRIHPRDAVAHEIMGDIYSRQGDTQRASTAFSYAIQFNPRNQSAQAKMERLMRHGDTQTRKPTITFSRARASHSIPTPLSELFLSVIPFAAGLILIATLALLVNSAGSPAEGAGAILGISLNLAASLFVSGLSLGIVLAFYGRLRPAMDELWSKRSAYADQPRSPVPLGAVLTLFALVWFYASFLLYIGIAATRNRFSPSILRMYAAALAMVLIVTLVDRSGPGSTWQCMLLAGNFLFPSMLLGWTIGDAFRLRGRF